MSLLKQLITTSPPTGVGIITDAYRKSLEVNGTVAGEQTDYQVEIGLDMFLALPSNAATFQTTPTSDATGQCVHPSILYFPDGWNGYNYWMVMTPYPGGDPDNETPEILACDDGVNWVVPAGLTNPIVDRDAAAPNSDPCLFYNEATDEIWIYYRKTDDAKTYDKIYLKKSSDGINWGGTGQGTLLLDLAYTQALSPAVVKVGAIYYLWYVNATTSPNEIKHRTSADGETWNAEGSCNLYGSMPSGKEPWHLEVRYMTDYSEYWMLLTVCTLDASGANSIMTFAKSADGTDWYLYLNVFLNLGAGGTWDDTAVYKATAILDDSTLKIWYSAMDDPGHIWHVGYTTATIDTNMIDVLSKIRSDGGDLRFTEDDGITELDYWLEEFDYGGYAIVGVKVPTIPVAGTTIYVYYGKPDETTTSNHTATMIKADNGVSGNFTEDTKGTAAFSYVGGLYRITEDSDDDAFASGTVLADWAWMTTIRVFKTFSTGGTDLVFFGLSDEDVIAQLCGDSAVVGGKRRFLISRYSNETVDAENKVVVMYQDTLGNFKHWDGDSWEDAVTRFAAAGDIELRIWSDGTTLYADVLKDGASIFTTAPSIAIASVKAFAEGRCMAWCDLYTNGYFVPQDIDRYFIRKYVSPEPTLGAWGAEEAVVWPF